MKSQLTARAALIVIAALFVFPLALAWMMWSGVIDFNPGSGRNLGELVQPPIPAELENHLDLERPVTSVDSNETSVLFEGHWVILHVVPAPCSSGCLDIITTLRQVHRASGRNQSRIQVALLLSDEHPTQTADQISRIYPSFILVKSPGTELHRVLAEIAAGFSARVGDSSYLIDPIGNIMMFYEAGSDPNHLKTDLKRLLTWSKLDK